MNEPIGMDPLLDDFVSHQNGDFHDMLSELGPPGPNIDLNGIAGHENGQVNWYDSDL